jgi:O-antigen/teichoic acid export membrane protein
MSIFALVTMSVLYRYMPSKRDVDSWVIFQQLFGLLETGRAGFLTTATVKFYAGSGKQRIDEVMGSSWFLGAAITLGMLVLNLPLLYVANVIGNEGFSFFFKWFGVTALFSLPAVIANCAVQASARFDRLLYMRLVTQLSFLGIVIYLIVSGNISLYSVLIANLLSHLITSIFLFVTGWSEITAWTKRTKKCIRELYDFGKYTVANNISSTLLRTSDIFIISFMFKGAAGDGLVAVYNLALKLMEIIEIPLRSLVATAMPTLSAAYNQNDRKGLIYTMQKYAGALTYALIPVCIGGILLADIAAHIVGAKNAVGPEAGNVLRIFLTFALLFPTDRFLALSLDAVHKPNINSIKILLMLAVNIAGDFIGIAIFHNIYGVTLATILPTLVGVFVGYWALNKYEPFSLRQIYTVGFKEAKLMIRKTLKLRPSVT